VTAVSAREDLARRVSELRWYHTLDLGQGIVTPGWFDTRPIVGRVPLPASLAGRRCLDVGTWDGFWAFEMERRGAAEVVAVDIADQSRWDWPPRARLLGGAALDERSVADFKAGQRAFDLARSALESSVRWHDVSVYDLDPAEVGEFDIVFLGSLLLHLRDPVRALERLRSVCAGEAVIADTVEVIPTLLHPRTPVARLEGEDRPWWWQPNLAGLRRMVRSAGFQIVERTGIYFIPMGPSHPRGALRDAVRRLARPGGVEELIIRWRGVPHAAVRARPLPAAG
jgi:tRNA (mo5U34)-methyltransferase